MKIWNAVEFAINKKTLWISCCIHGFPDLSHIANCDRYDLCLWYLLNIWTMFEYIHKLDFSILFQGSRGGPTLSGEGGGLQLFQGGPTFSVVNTFANFYRNTYNLWFSRRSWPPIPLWIRTCHDIRDTKLCTVLMCFWCSKELSHWYGSF